MGNYKNLLKTLFEQIDDCSANSDYLEREGFKELQNKFGEALATVIVDTHNAIISASLAYVASKLKELE